MKLLLRFLQLAGLNAVPGVGLFIDDWSAATVLALYWCESLIASLLIALRIHLHRSLTRKQGHYRDQLAARHGIIARGTFNGRPWQPATFLSGFLVTALAFSLAQGVALALLVSRVFSGRNEHAAHVDSQDLMNGLTATAAFLALGFALDLYRLGERPFAWIRRMAEDAVGRIMVVQGAAMVGLVAVVFTNQPRGLFGVFIVLKFFQELGSWLPYYNPDEAPRWLVRVIGRHGASFAAHWQKRRSAEVELDRTDELRCEPK